ncbi:hypothetical protein BBJ28_00009675, partial [Nothophytophthora sp. Chile5]
MLSRQSLLGSSRVLLARRLRPAALTRERRASFFSFPSPSRALVKSHTETKVVPFTCEEMFDVVADVSRYHEFLPFCVESRVLRRPNANVMEAALRIGFNIFTEAYTSRVTMVRPDKVVAKAIDSPTFKRIETTPGSCEVDFKVTFEVTSFLHANAIQLFFDDVALTQLNAFIGRARKLHGSAPRRLPQGSVAAKASSSSGGSTQPLVAASTKNGGSSVVPATPTTSPRSSEQQESSSARREAKARASCRIKGGISSQNYSDLAAIFQEFAEEDGKLHYNGFTAASVALGQQYGDFRDVSESAALAGAIFSSFETSAAPKDWLTMDEFVVGVYLMTKGTFEQKAHNLFEVVDSTGDGKISREELTCAMQRRIRAVKNLFPKLLHDQVQIQMAHEQVEALSSSQDAAVARGVQAIEVLMEEVEKEIPLAVNQIFREADLDQDDFIREEEWLFAWQSHPEFVELLTIDGMKKVAQWASVVQEHGTGDSDDDDDDPARTVGARGEREGIYTFKLDTSDGTLTPFGVTPLGINPMYVHGSNKEFSQGKRVIYALNALSDNSTTYPGTQTGYVSALTLNSNGTLELLNTLETHGGSPTHVALSPNEDFLTVANYAGSLTMFSLNED